MDEIRSSLDNIIARFNDSITHSAPKKLSFNRLSASFNDSDTVPVSTIKKRRLDSLDNGASNISLNISGNESSPRNYGPGQWQSDNVRAELIEAKAIIKQLQHQIEQKEKDHRSALMQSESKSSALKEQCDYTSAKMSELEKHLQVVRKREHTAKQEVNRALADLAQQKNKYEQMINQLKQEKLHQEEDARDVQSCINNELSEYRRLFERTDMELQATRNGMERMRRRHDEYKIRAAAFDDLKLSYEKQQNELNMANSRIKELEFEIASYNDWKEVTKTSQARLLSVPDMQAELERLRANNRHLHSLIGNKLLLEEQVHDYKARLDKEEGGRAEAASLQVKLSHVEQELKEWVKVAQDHCLPNTLVSPLALRSRLEQLLREDIVRVAEKSSSESDTKHLQTMVRELEQKCAVYMKNIEDMNMILKRNKNFKERLQRKLLMVSKERDFYKQLVENFDKDLTISNASTAEMTNDMQVRYRVEVLERTVAAYKDMCSTLEREIQAMRQQEVLPEPCSEGYDSVKKELDTLRMENERLRHRKDELELELEHRCLRGDFNIDKYKVVHLSNNPAAEAYENSKNIVEKLQAEIERLKRKNKKLEEDNESTQARFNETVGMTMNFKEVNQLRTELESANAKYKKMKDCFKAASLEFRDVCYMLLGYRIDRIGVNSHYRVSSMYAESPDDYLAIRLNESNCLELLETPYSQTTYLKPLTNQLAANNSFPAFFSALTLELFQRSTITIT
ncbi:mitotic spindle assembly checkpoint protein MAD1 [Scaptodrosophila lebanonensis]|uniref:Mitotic spindle assembly checkpoint protein MAD1 n=1 Tax=Drosophila lebanonensis TaxID=7225 RepID=A0A6J2U0N6_DROLE|nr:mitotic spindle assembly checkpoint protein MAD1 [Scaptodrosophila lebanonensis]